jgi:hypothetical protein
VGALANPEMCLKTRRMSKPDADDYNDILLVGSSSLSLDIPNEGAEELVARRKTRAS